MYQKSVINFLGTSMDWVYGANNINLTYTFEFRDKGNYCQSNVIEFYNKFRGSFLWNDLGQYGFVLPADQIIPNALEVLDGLKAIIKEANELNYL